MGWILLLALFWATGLTAQFIAPVSPVCSGSAQFYQVVSHPGSTYAWSLSAGAGSLSGNIGTGNSVFWGSPGTRTITVVESLFPSGTATYTATVTVAAVPNPVILPGFAPDCPPEDKPHENIIIFQPNDDPCPKACENMPISYSSPVHPGSTYEWFVGGGTPTHGFGNPFTITWGPAGTGSITLIEHTPAGCTGTATTCIEIIPSPVAAATGNGQDLAAGPVYICVDQFVAFHDQSVGGSSWFWDFGDGATSTDHNPDHQYTSAGTFYGKLVVKNACGCEDVLKFEVVVKDGVVPSLGCISTVCLNGTDLYNLYWPGMENCPGANITWKIHGGSVISYPNTPLTAAMVIWDDNDGFINQNGYGAIEVTVDGCDGVCFFPIWVEVPVIHPTHIAGIENACVGEVYTYSIPYQPGISPGSYSPGVDFSWHINPSGGAFVDPAPRGSSVEIRWNAPGDYTISVDEYANEILESGECKFKPKELVVHVLPNLEILPPLAQMCAGSTPPTWTAVVAGTTYPALAGPLDWTLETLSGTVLFSQMASGYTFTFPSGTVGAGNYLIHVQSPAYCAGGGYSSLQVFAPPTTTGTISGENQVCFGIPYTYTTNAVPPAGIEGIEVIPPRDRQGEPDARQFVEGCHHRLRVRHTGGVTEVSANSGRFFLVRTGVY